MKKTKYMVALSSLAILAAGVATPASANVCSSDISFHNWDSKFDGILNSSRGFQHPSTSFCIFYSSQSKRDQKITNVLYPEGTKMVFKADLPGTSGARSELRSNEIPNNTTTTYVLKGAANIPGGQTSSQFTIGQLFADDRNGSARPVVRIEYNKGSMRAVIKKSLGSNDNSTNYESGDAGKRSVSSGEIIDFEIRQKRINNDNINLVVKIEGETLFSGNVFARTGSDNYFKLGCYVNSSSSDNDCIAKFNTATISPGL